MVSIHKAEYAGEYSIKLTFNDGKIGVANLEKTIFSDKRKIFSKIKSKVAFKNFKIDHNTVIWFDELDLAPEYLYFLAFQNNSEYHKQFKDWGYIE